VTLRKRHQRGLTLIEVLVALAVLSAVVGSIMVLIGQHTRQASALEDRMLARIVAENALAERIAERSDGGEQRRGGEVELAGRSFRFAFETQPSTLQNHTVETVSVRKEESQQVLASISTLRGPPGE
jgi:general secretion pathway protein I